MSDKVKGLILVFIVVFLVALIGSWFTISSLNVLFNLDVPITIETILAVTWLTITLKGIFSPASLKQ